MNLQEAMNYRTQCVVCGRNLVTIVAGHEKSLTVEYDQKSLLITGSSWSSSPSHGVKLMEFFQDGTFQRSKRNFALYRRPIQIWRGCPVCRCDGNVSPQKTPGTTGTLLPTTPSTWKSRRQPVTQPEIWDTTLDNLRSSGCLFYFSLWGDSTGKYDLQPKMDCLRYFNETQFWHVTTDFEKGQTTFQTAKFAQTLNELNTLKLPAVNLSKVTNIEEFLNKFKLYTVFS